jgi:endoglucanase
MMEAPRSPHRTVVLIGSIVALLVFLGPLAPASASGEAQPVPAMEAPLVPDVGALFGAYVDPDNQWTGTPAAIAEVSTFESTIGRKLNIDQHYYGWTQTFPGELETWDVSEDRIPLVTWHGTNLDEIISGADDALIHTRAQAVRDFGAPIFLRWGWEMNGDWYEWSGIANNTPGATDGPAKYVAAWRHIHDIFVEENVTNAVWVWSINHESVPRASWNAPEAYYPGDEYVDWVGIDGYNWGTTRGWSKWRDFSALFDDTYSLFHQHKPIMIAEASSVETGGNKAAWIAQVMAQLPVSYPDIRALVWFDVDKEADWRPDSSDPSLSAYKVMGDTPYFNQVGVPSVGGGGTGDDPGDNGTGDNPGGGGDPDDHSGSTKPPPKFIHGIHGKVTPRRHRAVITFRATQWVRVWVTITRPNGTVVRHRLRGALFRPGKHRIMWHLRSDRARRVGVGRFVVTVLAMDRQERADTARAPLRIPHLRR